MFITGTSADGSDAVFSQGVYMSPDGTWWSNKPISKEQRAYEVCYNLCVKRMISFRTLHERLESGHEKVKLKRWVRLWLDEALQEDHGSYPVVDLKELLQNIE